MAAVQAIGLRAGAIPREPEETLPQRLYRRWFNVIWGTVSVSLFIGFWELAMRLGWIDPFFLSSPSKVLEAARGYVGSKEFFTDLGTSSAEFTIGFVASIVLGVLLGIAVGWYRFAHALLHPILFALYVVPHVAFLPLVIMWFGIGIPAKAIFVTLSGVFAVLYNTSAAVHTIDPKLVTAARSFKATDLQVLRTVVLPGSVPMILAGVRLAVGKCLTAMVVAEFWASFSGIGNLIARSAAFYLIGKMFVGVLIIALLGVLLTELVRLVEDHFDSWRVSQAGQH